MNNKSLKSVKFAMCMAALVIVWMPISASAQSCDSLVQGINNYFGNQQGTVQVALVSNRSDGRYASYAEMPSKSGNNGGSGPLTYRPANNWLPASLTGTLAQFFSDRRFNYSYLLSDPFNPQATDALAITIWLGYYPRYGITPGLVSLNGGNVVFQGQCQDGMINGFYTNTEFVLSLFGLQK
jgi:hypothetical protein